MKIGIIAYSQTGNTLQVAEKLAARLRTKGHMVVIEQVTTTGSGQPDPKNIQLAYRPNPSIYDGLIFATPVQGFAVAPAMALYLNQIPTLTSRKIACFVTHYFPFPGLGASQTVAQMKKLCQVKGGTIIGSGIINWSRGNRERQIETMIDRLVALY